MENNLAFVRQALNNTVRPVDPVKGPYRDLLKKLASTPIVLMGEATHGTEEFYQARMQITQLLIENLGFNAIAIEGDWPAVYPIHRYIQGRIPKAEVESALDSFKRFPRWMWRNTAMLGFLRWLRDLNDARPMTQKVGFYGLDLYSLYTSVDAVLNYLHHADPKAAELAKKRYACFDHAKKDSQWYGYLVNEGLKKACIQEAMDQFAALKTSALKRLKQDGFAADESYFYALQNARVVKNAEHYYRTLFAGRVSSWNIRDQHMGETLVALVDHLTAQLKKPAKVIVWAHNSHIGDARATEMGEAGELNLGQLMRQHYGAFVHNIGFSTYEGTVTAASNWGEPAETKTICPGMPSSYEALFHALTLKDFVLDVHDAQIKKYLHIPHLQRAIGVVYKPETERLSHYFFSHLTEQFDTLLHFDKTHALTPLD